MEFTHCSSLHHDGSALPFDTTKVIDTTAIDAFGGRIQTASDIELHDEQHRHDCHTEQVFVRTVWNALCAAGVSPTKLFIEIEISSCDKCEGHWRVMNADSLSHARLMNSEAGWRPPSGKALHTTNALTSSASLKRVNLSGHYAAADFLDYVNEQPELQWPSVTSLARCTCDLLNVDDIHKIMDRFPSLKYAELFRVTLDNEPRWGKAWFDIFTTLRNRGIAGDFFDLTTRRSRTTEGMLTLRVFGTSEEIRMQLQDYVASRGVWTAKLNKEFRLTMASVAAEGIRN